MKLKLLLIAIFGGFLMGISWPETGGLSPLFFIALIPLLYVENVVYKNEVASRFLFLAGFLCFLTFNTFTTWWIWFASDAGMIIAVVLNSLFMSTIFLWFHSIRKKLGENKGYFALIALWLGFEWLHYNWEISHPWSTFGNVFANSTSLIQWYEYTGVLGGSLWVLLTNVLIFKLLVKVTHHKESLKENIRLISLITSIVIIPIVISLTIFYNYKIDKNDVEVVVIQPNIDPYTEKFGGMSEYDQIERILSLAKEKATEETDYIIAPETAIPRGFYEDQAESNRAIIAIRNFLENYPNAVFVIGASTYIHYPESDVKPTSTARPSYDSNGWFDAFNSALQIKLGEPIQYYHKSKLVLGVEKLPFAFLLSPLEDFAIDLGGTMGSLGTEKEAKIFNSQYANVAPVICYESIYGEYFSEYINKGANAAFIITNDGWWEDTPGYRQHLAYARLRCIETRRSIARSANTGISCVINEKGDISNQTVWWQPDSFNTKISLNESLTFYSKHGDFTGRIAAFIAMLLLFWNITLYFKKRANY